MDDTLVWLAVCCYIVVVVASLLAALRNRNKALA